MTRIISFAAIRKNSKLRAAIFTTTFFVVFAGLPLMAGVIAPSNCLPPGGDQYTGGVESWVAGLTTVDLSNPIHNRFTACIAPSTNPGDSWIESFSSTVSGELFVNGGDIGPVSGSAAVTIHATVLSNAGGVETLDTQMTQLDLNLGGGTLVRIDPITPTTGQTTITDTGGGTYRIDSFFDVFTELSLDNGITWFPATDPTRMTLEPGTPEPGSIALALAGLLLVGTRTLLRRPSGPRHH